MKEGETNVGSNEGEKKRMYLRWGLRTLYLHACQARVTEDDLGLCCCACVMSFESFLKKTPLCVDSVI